MTGEFDRDQEVPTEAESIGEVCRFPELRKGGFGVVCLACFLGVTQGGGKWHSVPRKVHFRFQKPT